MDTSRNKIFGALLIGFGLVGVAFMASQYTPYASSKNKESSSSVTTVQRQYIPVPDSDGDGVPNWQDALLDPEPIRINDTPTSSYQHSESLTSRFGIKFFKEVTNLQLEGRFEKEKDTLITAAIEALVQETRDDLYTKEDIKTVASDDSETLRSYGELIALIIVTHPVKAENETDILEDAREKNNKERLNDLIPIRDAYADMVKQMLDVVVPETYQKEHLDLLNTYNAMLKNIEAMQGAFEDPLYSYLRLKRYDEDVLGMTNALTRLFSALYLRDGIRWENESAVLQVVQFNEENET